MRIKRILTAVLAAVTLSSSISSAIPVQADQVDAPYLALGADLSETEKSTVLKLLEVDPAKLDQYMVVTVTNQDEHNYLDAYMDASVIGSRALSSVVVEKKEAGTGIKVKNTEYHLLYHRNVPKRSGHCRFGEC